MSESDLEHREDLEEQLHTFLQDAANSGKYGKFKGIVTGWSIWIDRLNPDDGDLWSTRLDAPGQAMTLSIGQHAAAQHQCLSGWTDSEDLED